MSHLMSGITATATIAALILLTASAEAKCPPGGTRTLSGMCTPRCQIPGQKPTGPNGICECPPGLVPGFLPGVGLGCRCPDGEVFIAYYGACSPCPGGLGLLNGTCQTCLPSQVNVSGVCVNVGEPPPPRHHRLRHHHYSGHSHKPRVHR